MTDVVTMPTGRERIVQKMHLRADAIVENVTAFISLAGELRETFTGDRAELEFKRFMAEEFAGTFAGLAPVLRRSVVVALTDLGMTTRTIAPIVGASQPTVARDVEEVIHVNHFPEADPQTGEVIEAEIVDDEPEMATFEPYVPSASATVEKVGRSRESQLVNGQVAYLRALAHSTEYRALSRRARQRIIDALQDTINALQEDN